MLVEIGGGASSLTGPTSNFFCGCRSCILKIEGHQDRPRLKFFTLGSEGTVMDQRAIEAFAARHTCSALCQQLGLEDRAFLTARDTRPSCNERGAFWPGTKSGNRCEIRSRNRIPATTMRSNGSTAGVRTNRSGVSGQR